MDESKYFLKDFTTINYGRLLDLSKQSFVNRTFSTYAEAERFVIWRHDIDISPQRALKLAEIESEKDIIATYFIYLHSNFYNALEAEVYSVFKKIIRLGHSIGLHFDPVFYDIDDIDKFEYWLRREADLLKDLLSEDIMVFSFHNTTPFAVTASEHLYCGLINATSSYFRSKVAYCSDSNGYWRFKRLEDVLRDHEVQKLQVLTHPEWWHDEVMPPRKRVVRCAEGRYRKTIEKYDAGLNEYNRKNVDRPVK
jgi:hypothetical protein